MVTCLEVSLPVWRRRQQHRPPMPERRGDGEHWIQAAQHGAVHQHLACGPSLTGSGCSRVWSVHVTWWTALGPKRLVVSVAARLTAPRLRRFILQAWINISLREHAT
eukprot:360244-Chlamydomonas_euryale.AAC.4